MRCNLCQHDRFLELPFFYEWDGKRFQGLRCRNCRLVTLDPLPTKEELTRLYGEEYFDSGLHGLQQAGVDYETLADRRQDDARRFIREVIRKRHPSARTLCEIGAAMGHFLLAAREEGFTCAGVEFSEAAVARATEKFGLDLVCGNIEELELPDWHGKWDVIYAGDLLEHLRDPAGMVAKAARLLAPGGLCVMRVPGTFNLLSTRLAIPLLRLLGRQKKLPDKPYHLYEFTTGTVRRLFRPHFARLEILNEATPPRVLNLKTRSADYLAKSMLQVFNYPLTRLTNRFGDRMTVFAWKT